MNERKIIFLNRVYWPSTAATAQLLTDLAEGLSARGWSVHVITNGEKSTQHNGVKIHRTGTPDSHGGLLSRTINHRHYLSAARAQLGKLVRPGDIVVPMTDPPLLASNIVRIATRAGATVVPWIQDIYPEIAAVHFGSLAGFFLSPLKAARNSAWLAAHHLVTLGEDMKQAVTHAGVTTDRCSIIPNWAPHELHQPASPDAITHQRQQWGLTGKFVIAYSGNLGRVHEFATVLQAAALLRGNATIVFLFIGQGVRFNVVSSFVAKNKLPNVRLLPPEPRENLPVSLAAADVQLVTLQPRYTSLVYPSKLAGVLAARRPVLFVGPTNGDIAQLLRQQDCGEALAPNDAEGLATIISQWQTDSTALTHLGANSRAAYEQLFTRDSALAHWNRLLRQVAGLEK